jgi:hypothetical protein
MNGTRCLLDRKETEEPEYDQETDHAQTQVQEHEL